MAQDDKRQSCSPEQLQAYFDRIELPDRLRDCGPRLEQLTALQAHHLAHIPWENLTLTFPELRNPDDTPLVETFTLDRLMSKLVHRKMRGGFCFEQNQLLQIVLGTLGYDVYANAARVVQWDALVPGSSHVPLKPHTHQVLLVKLGGKVYLVDVGFMSDNHCQPLPLQHMAASVSADGLPCGRRQHRLRRGVIFSNKGPEPSDDPATVGWYLQVDSSASGWKDLYFFTEALFDAADFIPFNWFVTSNPKSPFIKVPHVAILTEQGRKTLVDRTFRVFIGKTMVSERKLEDGEVKEVLKQEFNIVF